MLSKCQATRNLEGDFILLTGQCYEVITTSIVPVSHKESGGTKRFSDLGKVVQLRSENARAETPARLETFVLMSSRIHGLRDQVSHSPPETGSVCLLPDP